MTAFCTSRHFAVLRNLVAMEAKRGHCSILRMRVLGRRVASNVTATTDFLAPDILNKCGRAFPALFCQPQGPAKPMGAKHRGSASPSTRQRVMKGPSEPPRLTPQQQREVHARLKVGEPRTISHAPTVSTSTRSVIWPDNFIGRSVYWPIGQIVARLRGRG